MRRPRPVAVRRAGRREQVGVTVFPLHFQVPKVCGEPTVIREEPAVQEETQVPLQVSTDKVASFPLPSDSGTVSEPQSVCGRVAMVARDCWGIRLTKVVRGSFHQGDSRFSYGGMQCMAIAASSIAKHVVKSVFSWETRELDRILYSGDEFYSSLRNLGIFSHPSHFLSVPDLPSNVLIDEQLFCFHFSQHPASGAVGVEQENGPFVTLRNGLEGIFSQYSMCLLTLVTSTSAIICEDGQFAVVDSHSRSSCGLVDHNGTSVILHFSCLDDLHHYICCLADALSPGLKPFELCGVRVSVGASPALSGASVESCIFEMNTTAAPELTDIKDVCATTSLFESDAGPAVSHAQSGVSVESGFIEMSTVSAPGFSHLAKNSAAPSVCHSGNGVEASPALSGASVLTFLSEVSSGSTAEFVASDGKKRKIFSRERMSKQSKRFDSNIDNSDVVFITASESGKLFFRPLGEDVCRALCSQLKVHFVKVGGLVHREVGYLGVPCLSEKIVPDGNCFFRAVSQAVSGSQKNHRKIRLAACRELEKNEARYRGLLRSEMSLLQYIKQSRMKCVNTWATEVEIQATADYLGIDIFTFHDGRWLKYRCSSKCLSADCIYLENVGGQHFEYVVCVLKPGLHSCHGYCKLGWDIGCSTRSSVKDGAEHPYQESTPGRLRDVQEEAQVPLQVFIDKVAFFPPPSGSVSEPQSVCGRVAMVARDCRGFRLSKVVRGSFHQGDSRFSYGGMQCMAIAASSIAKHVVKSVFSWETQELDRILYSGDEFYSSLRNLGIFSHPSHFLSVPDLPSNVVIDEQLFSFHFSQHPASGAVGVEQENGPFVTLRNGLEGIFSQYSMCLLTLVTSTSAIICEDGQFAVVDSHSRSSCGLVDHNGTSVILHFSCLDDLHHYICCLADALSRGPKPFELCGVRVSVGASPALSGASVESCIFEMNTAAAPKLSDINVCATTSLFESDAGPAVSHAQSGVPVESGFIEMSTAPAPGFSDLDKDFAAPSVCQTGAGVEACPALSGASVLTLSEVSSGSTAAFVATDGKKRSFFSGERMSKQSKRFDSVLVNSDVVFVSASESDKLFFRPLGDDVCRALCSQLKVDFMKVGGLVHREVCYLGVPCLSEKIVPDGNCFFRAVSQAVSGSQKNHRKIRLAACRELENNEARYRGLLRSEMSLLEYIKQSRMKCVKTWATEVEIQATADYLGIDIFTFHDGRWLQGQLWICFTCHSKISKGQFPAECWNNNLAVHLIPPELGCLNSLEQHLIALRIPFMKALALPKGGQNGVHGPVTCVPANIVQTTNVLPRSSMEGSLLQVKLKRKLTYKGHYEYQFVDSWRVRRAIEYLKRTNVLYKDIEFNEEWSNDFCREEEVVVEAGQVKQVVVDTQSSEDEAVEQEIGAEEESEDIAQDEMLHDRQQHCMFQDTCLMPVDIGQEALDQYFADVVCLAPAEGNSPVRMLSDKLNEAKCFPVLFPTSTNTFHTRRTHRLTLSRYFNNRIMHADGRFARNVEYIFFSQYMSELDKVISSISVAMRKGKGGQHSQRISPGMLKDDESLKRLLQFDDGFRFLRPIRGTPAFWSSVQKDLLACVRQLGIPTWFCSFSSADLRWQNLLASILRQEGRQQTVEQLEWADRCELLRRNPVTAARMFDYRWHCFLKEVLMSPSQPVGKIVDFFYRIEFQQRGSPHVHALFWIEGAPQIYKNTDVEVAEFVDKYVTCELPSGDDTLLEVVSSVQTHSKRHSKSCRKNKTVCRFNFPKPISARTFICKIKECVCPKKGTGTEGDRTSENRPKCTCFDDEGRKMPKEVAKMFMERVKNAMGREEPFGSVEELFASVGINQEVFELAYRRLETKNKVVYRRGVNDTWVNQYNRNLLKCWNANMDISFVTDAYAVIIYIIKYITKSETEMGLLLSNALKEANKLGNLSAKDALKKLGSVYLHNRDVCAQEAVYRLMSMHLKECSRKVVFIPTGNNIVRMSLPLSVLLQRASSEGLRSENMWMTSIVERYKNRPDSVVFEDMCIATFCSEYRILTQNENSDNKIELQGGLGFVLRRTRTQFAVVRYMRFKLDKQEEAHFQSLLQLFLPYRTDLELKPEGFEFYKQFHEEGNVTSAGGTERPVRDVVDENRAKFEVDCPRLERAQEIADMLGGVDEDAWGDLCPEQQVEHMECLEERQQQQQGEIRDEQLLELEENVPDLFVGGKQVATIERNTNILPRREGLALVHSLNETQRSIFDRIRKWCLQKVMGKTPEPFHVFVTGGAGTGKSHLIRAIQYEAGRLLSRLYQPDETCVLLTAPTGIAAYSLHAATIHHTFSIGMQVSLPYIPLGEDKINSLRAQFGHLQILIIDEISMVDHHLLAYVHGRLRQIKQTGDFSPFGNVSVVAVGDFYQLPPVKGRPLYTCQVGVDLWCHFTKVELKTVVRQKDSVFSELLNRLRVRSKETPLLQSDVDILKSRETGEQSAALHIYPTNMQASEHNLKRLFATCPDYVTIEAQDFINSRKTGELERVVGHHGKTSYTCLAKSLCLAPEARVMLCKNVAVADGLVNGACGTVTYIQFGADEDFPLVVYVKFDDPKIGSQRRKERSHAAVECPHSTAIDPVEDSATKRGGLRRQFPLKLAWACTVHKVQGLTVDEAVVCLHKIFAAGQAYVALSRVRDISGLVITDFEEKAIYCKHTVKGALDSMPPFLLEQPQPSLETPCFSVYLLNVQNLRCHVAHLVSCTQHLQPTCIAVTETWLSAQSSTDCVQIEGYTFHSRPRALCYSSNDVKLSEIRDLEHGGVGLYVVDNSDCEILQVPDLNLECLVCLFTKENLLMAYAVDCAVVSTYFSDHEAILCGFRGQDEGDTFDLDVLFADSFADEEGP
nr:uncharacterized protein LOC133608199 [Nerophis lumbriciformis]